MNRPEAFRLGAGRPGFLGALFPPVHLGGGIQDGWIGMGEILLEE